MSEKEGKSRGGIAGIMAALFGMSAGKVLGMALFIPAGFGLFSHFALKKIDKKLKGQDSSFGGLGTTYPESVPYKGLLALELGHVMWGILGVAIYLSGALKTAEVQLDSGAFIEQGGYLALVVFFILKPNWCSILLLAAYHCAAIYGISQSFETLSSFPRSTREALELSAVSHGLLHGLAIFGLTWFSFALISKGRSPLLWLKCLMKKRVEIAGSRGDTRDRLKELQSLLDNGLINESDFEKKKTEILSDL